MNFSMKTGLAAFTFVCIAVAAYCSRSIVFIETMSFVLFLGILISLPFAWFADSKLIRGFCFGFFVLAMGVYLSSGSFTVTNQLADLLISPMRQVQPTDLSASQPLSTVNTLTTYPTPSIQVQPTFAPLSPPVIGAPTNFVSSNYVFGSPYQPGYPSNAEEIYVLHGYARLIWSVIFGLAGGLFTVLFIRTKKQKSVGIVSGDDRIAA